MQKLQRRQDESVKCFSNAVCWLYVERKFKIDFFSLYLRYNMCVVTALLVSKSTVMSSSDSLRFRKKERMNYDSKKGRKLYIPLSTRDLSYFRLCIGGKISIALYAAAEDVGRPRDHAPCSELHRGGVSRRWDRERRRPALEPCPTQVKHVSVRFLQ